MTVYWTVAILTVLINLLPVKNEKQYFLRLFISLIPLFLYGALRVDYGLDYNTYEVYFDRVKEGFLYNDRFEIGYYYLNKYLPTFRSLLIVQCMVLCIAYFYLFKWYVPAKYAWLGFALLFLSGPVTIYFMLSGIRNGMAISLLILSTHFIYTKKIIQYSLLVIVAYLFHNSVIFFAPVAYFIGSRMTISKSSMIIWLTVMMLISVLSNTFVFSYINDIVTVYFERYSSYTETALYQSQKLGILAYVFSFMVCIILFLLFKNKILTEKEKMIVNFTLLFIMSYIFGAMNLRMTQYFASFFVVGSLIVFYKETNQILKQAYLWAIFAYSIYALNLWFNSPYYSYDIYKTVLFN